MIRFNCRQCGSRLTASDGATGKKGKCPKCGTGFVVPARRGDSAPAGRAEPDTLSELLRQTGRPAAAADAPAGPPADKAKPGKAKRKVRRKAGAKAKAEAAPEEADQPQPPATGMDIAEAAAVAAAVARDVEADADEPPPEQETEAPNGEDAAAEAAGAAAVEEGPAEERMPVEHILPEEPEAEAAAEPGPEIPAPP